MRLFKRGVDMTNIMVLSLALVVYVVVYGIIVAKCIKKQRRNKKNNAQFLKEEHIKLLKNKFNEWDNMYQIFKIKIINIKENDNI